jgi:D-cysteine desulfhydrase
MSGATVRFISPEEYADRDRLMHAESERLIEAGRKPYVIVEGGSSGLGALGYVDAVAELLEQQQLDLCPMSFDTVVCACGSGGTAAGLSLGVGRYGTASRVDAMAVCDDTPTFQAITTRICDEARALRPDLPQVSNLTIHDAYRGPAYGEMSDEQREFLHEVVACCGLVLDPVYSGKALFGLSQLDPKPRQALFIHTGGLPGMLA